MPYPVIKRKSGACKEQPLAEHERQARLHPLMGSHFAVFARKHGVLNVGVAALPPYRKNRLDTKTGRRYSTGFHMAL